MARVLILSSFVAAGRVGGGAQVLALARLGIEPILIPTVLLGRHPGHGAPGGGPVAPETFERVLEGVEAQDLFAALDAVITGYFATAEQVAIAADALDRIKAAAPEAQIVVDPIMGDDDNGLYVNEAAAVAIAERLVPHADLICPNVWELGRLAGFRVASGAEAVVAAARLQRPALVSSVPAGDDIGVIYAGPDEAWLASHRRAPAAPKGTGDLLTGFFLAARLAGLAGGEALAAAVGPLAELIAASGAVDSGVGALPTRLAPSPRVRLEELDA